MKIHIAFPIRDEPTGGGNQFLRAMRKHFAGEGVYEETPAAADVILFNSCQQSVDVLQLKKRFPSKVFVHRVDGPMRLYNDMSDRRDLVVNAANAAIADGTIFQSDYSRNANYDMGLRKSAHEVVILNAPDPTIFRPVQRRLPEGPVQLIATSWSDNMNKGFADYQWLDEHLDFSAYRMRFVGRSPIQFRNIECLPPQPSEKIAALLSEAHIYVTGSRKDPCSNSLIEAAHSGLPVIALKDGGHPELAQGCGLLYENVEEVPDLLVQVQARYEELAGQHRLPDFVDVGARYLSFLQQVFDACNGQGKSMSAIEHLRARWAIWRS